MTFSEFTEQARTFLNAIQTDINNATLPLEPHWDIDHICYRVETYERYDEIKSLLNENSNLLAETEVNGRSICTFKLNKALSLGERRILLIELPAPKEGKPIPEGFEHIEVVADISFAELKSKYRDFPQKTGGLEKDFNQELAISLDSYAVKFHHLSLESVVKLENNTPVFNAIEKSQVLSLLREYRPLVAGTFPLGIATPDSDVDVLLCADDLEELKAKIESHFGEADGFESYISEQGGEAYLMARFRIHGVAFELFGQTTESVQQRAYKHFQIEERLLKLGGESFKNRILSLRASGEKTEPAFAKALGLSGDPYLELLRLQVCADSELSSLLKKECT